MPRIERRLRGLVPWFASSSVRRGVVAYESEEGIEHLAKMLAEAWHKGREGETAYASYYAMLNRTITDQTRALRICLYLAEKTVAERRSDIVARGAHLETVSVGGDLSEAEEAASMFINEVTYNEMDEAYDTFVMVASQGSVQDMLMFVNLLVGFSCTTA